jgi:hypothetical protein
MQARFCRIVTTPRCNCFRMRRLPRFSNDPNHWRERANQMRAVAAEATDPKVKAAAFGAADAYDKLAQLEESRPALELPDTLPYPVVVEKPGALLSGLPSVRDFAAPPMGATMSRAPFSSPSGRLPRSDGFASSDTRHTPPPLATASRPARTGDRDHEMLRRFAYGRQDRHQVDHLPRAVQLPPIPGLFPVDAHRTVPNRVSFDLHKRKQAPTLRRPDRALSTRTSFLAAGALIAVAAGCFVVAVWSPEMDFADAPIPMPNERRLSPLPQVGLAPIPLNGRAAESEISEREPKSSEDKLTSGIGERWPQLLPAAESTTKGDMSAMPGSDSVHQAPPIGSADAAVDVRNQERLIQRESQSFATTAHDSSCFPSASAVREDNPTAWPSWTLRAPGHEGTKCWYAGTRPAAARPSR